MVVTMNEEHQPQSERDAAIDWLMRRNEGRLSRREQAAFDAWLAADPRNRAAFDDISEMFGRLTAMEFDRAPRRRAHGAPRAVATLSAIAALVALVVFFDDVSMWLRSDYYAAPGATTLMTLADGSRVQLDSRSAIAVRYAAGERRVALVEGQAWFEVAPDAARPFVVEAAGGTVTALGTAFDVSLEQGRTSVTVGEHRVAVASGGSAVVVGEGQESVYAPGRSAEPPRVADLARATAWRNRSLIFDDATLGEVVAALGRYHRGHVVFADPALRARRVSGVFGSSDPAEALEEIGAAVGLHVTTLTKYLIILY
jgi:transmembrane sensor